jgi:hypothetical protein
MTLLPDCDTVPGSLGGARSVPWCRKHDRYAAACEAVAARNAEIAEAVRGLPGYESEEELATDGYIYDPAGVMRAAVLAIVDPDGTSARV